MFMFHRSSVMASAITLLGIGLVPSFAPAGDDPTKELQKLQGRWRLVETEHFKGETVTGTTPASPAQVMVIKGEKIIIPAEHLELPFSLDVTKSPKQIKRTIRYAVGNNKFELREWLRIYNLVREPPESFLPSTSS